MRSSEQKSLPSVLGRQGFAFLVLFSLFAFPTVTPLFSQGSAHDHFTDSTKVDKRKLQWRLGVAGLVGLTTHQTTLDIYHGSSSCGEFTDQVTGVTALRLFFEMPLLGLPSFLLTGGAGWQNRPINFSETFTNPARYLDGVSEQVVTQHRLDASVSAVSISGGLLWEPVQNLRLGFTPSLLLLSVSDVRQYEQIASPLGATYTETNDFQRPIYRGGKLDFNNLGFEISTFGGTRLPLGDRFALIPELGVSLMTTSIEKSYQWNTTTFHASMGFTWENRSKKQELIATIPSRLSLIDPGDTHQIQVTEVDIVPPQSVDTATDAEVDNILSELYASISVVGVDDAGNEYPDPIIEIREAPWSRSIPFIPHLFFDRGSPTIPSRYIRFKSGEEADRFNFDSLVSITPIDLHHHLLNVLGQRLRSRPEVSVTIVGTATQDEEPNPELALERAKSVRTYLTDVWGIDERRVSVSSGTPTNPSSEKTVDGRSENRRAEFIFDGESLLRPVVVEGLASVASPPAINFHAEVDDTASVADWNITVRQGNKVLLRFDSTAMPDQATASKYWPLNDLRINRDLTPIHYRFEVTDIYGQKGADKGSFRVLEHVTRTPEEKTEKELEVKEYMLVGFTYNKAELRPQHVAEIYEIARAAEEGAWVEITGFTDRVGDALRNRELALERARNVEKRLQSVRFSLSLPELSVTSVRGSGESSSDTFDNNLPEGRIFSRMVRITVNRQSKE
ncbi:MAG: OmpA family protein [Chlorobi bacterium]|nr:OmpA family protein [Chlorobiota bacterium]